MIGWWLILYYPVVIALLFIGTRVDKRFAPGSAARQRADMALGCAILALPAAPLILGLGWIAVHNAGSELVQLAEIVGVFWFGLALIYGAAPWLVGAGNRIARLVVAALERRR